MSRVIAGVRARKRLGQHFLRDRSALERILKAAELNAADEVLEVGGGTGVLTEALAATASRVVAVELDDALAEHLAAAYAAVPSVTVWHGNALAFDPCEHFAGAYKLVANIPYYITGPLLRRFLETACQPALLVLMVQREVAERMAAAPGELSLLGVSVQYYAHVDVVSRVPAGSFYPRPKVDSAIVRLVPHRHHSGDVAERAFFTVARAGFGLKRKQLVNSLMHGLGLGRQDALSLLASAGIAATRRAETLSLDEWLALARAWQLMEGG